MPSVIAMLNLSTCCGDRQASWGVEDPRTLWKVVEASDDGGKTWAHVGSPGPMQWPQIFKCASGTVLCVHAQRAAVVTAWSSTAVTVVMARTAFKQAWYGTTATGAGNLTSQRSLP